MQRYKIFFGYANYFVQKMHFICICQKKVVILQREVTNLIDTDMKKVLSCILMAIVALSFVACGGSKSNNNASKIVGKWHYEDQWATEIISFNSDNTCQMRVIYNGKNTPYDVEGTIFYKYDEDTNVLEMHKDGDPTFNYQNSFIKLRWDNDNCLYLLYSDYQNEVGPFVRL